MQGLIGSYHLPSSALKIIMWDRDLWCQAMEWQTKGRFVNPCEPFQMITEFKEIFIGHTTTMYWKTNQPLRAANIINIDTGSGKEGKLTIMDVATKEFWQSDSYME